MKIVSDKVIDLVLQSFTIRTTQACASTHFFPFVFFWTRKDAKEQKIIKWVKLSHQPLTKSNRASPLYKAVNEPNRF